MPLFDPKISLDKSWKFTPQVLILIILGIIVIFGVLVLVGQLLKIPPPPAQPGPALPTEFIETSYEYISRGTIQSIQLGPDSEEGIVFANLEDPPLLYQLIIDKNTSIIRQEKDIRDPENPSYLHTPISLSDFGENDRVEVVTSEDIKGKSEIKDVIELRLIEKQL